MKLISPLLDQLLQLRQVTPDGDIANKTARDALCKKGLAVRVGGLNALSADGIILLDNIGLASPPPQIHMEVTSREEAERIGKAPMTNATAAPATVEELHVLRAEVAEAMDVAGFPHATSIIGVVQELKRQAEMPKLPTLATVTNGALLNELLIRMHKTGAVENSR